MRSAKIIQCRKLNDWYLCSDSLMNVTSFPSLFYLLSPKLAELVALASWLMLTCSTWMKASRREDWRSTLRYPRGQEQHRNVTSYASWANRQILSQMLIGSTSTFQGAPKWPLSLFWFPDECSFISISLFFAFSKARCARNSGKLIDADMFHLNESKPPRRLTIHATLSTRSRAT